MDGDGGLNHGPVTIADESRSAPPLEAEIQTAQAAFKVLLHVTQLVIGSADSLTYNMHLLPIVLDSFAAIGPSKPVPTRCPDSRSSGLCLKTTKPYDEYSVTGH